MKQLKILTIGLGNKAAQKILETLKEKEIKNGDTLFVSKDFREGDCEFEVRILEDTVEVWLTCIHYGFWGEEENWKTQGKNLPSVFE